MSIPTWLFFLPKRLTPKSSAGAETPWPSTCGLLAAEGVLQTSHWISVALVAS
jgi:hypothetical protein